MENSKAEGSPPSPTSAASCSRTHSSAGARLCCLICGRRGGAGRRVGEGSTVFAGALAAPAPAAQPPQQGCAAHLLQHRAHPAGGCSTHTTTRAPTCCSTVCIEA